MSKITTKSGMRDYIKKRLGYPVINIEVSNDQLDEVIDDTVQVMQRYAYGETIHNDYLTFTTSAGVDEYSLSGNNVTDVYDFEFSSGTEGINTLFSPTNMLLYEDWVVRGNYPSRGVSQTQLTSYDISMEYLENVENMFYKDYAVDYWPSEEKLKVLPTPDEALTGILFVYRKSDANKIYNHIHTKNLAVAKAKILWGGNLSKINMQIPGGGEFNGRDIKEEGKQDEEKIIQDIIDETMPPPFYVG